MSDRDQGGSRRGGGNYDNWGDPDREGVPDRRRPDPDQAPRTWDQGQPRINGVPREVAPGVRDPEYDYLQRQREQAYGPEGRRNHTIRRGSGDVINIYDSNVTIVDGGCQCTHQRRRSEYDRTADPYYAYDRDRYRNGPRHYDPYEEGYRRPPAVNRNRYESESVSIRSGGGGRYDDPYYRGRDPYYDRGPSRYDDYMARRDAYRRDIGYHVDDYYRQRDYYRDRHYSYHYPNQDYGVPRTRESVSVRSGNGNFDYDRRRSTSGGDPYYNGGYYEEPYYRTPPYVQRRPQVWDERPPVDDYYYEQQRNRSRDLMDLGAIIYGGVNGGRRNGGNFEYDRRRSTTGDGRYQSPEDRTWNDIKDWTAFGFGIYNSERNRGRHNGGGRHYNPDNDYRNYEDWRTSRDAYRRSIGGR